MAPSLSLGLSHPPPSLFGAPRPTHFGIRDRYCLRQWRSDFRQMASQGLCIEADPSFCPLTKCPFVGSIWQGILEPLSCTEIG